MLPKLTCVCGSPDGHVHAREPSHTNQRSCCADCKRGIMLSMVSPETRAVKAAAAAPQPAATLDAINPHSVASHRWPIDEGQQHEDQHLSAYEQERSARQRSLFRALEKQPFHAGRAGDVQQYHGWSSARGRYALSSEEQLAAQQQQQLMRDAPRLAQLEHADVADGLQQRASLRVQPVGGRMANGAAGGKLQEHQRLRAPYATEDDF